MKKKFVMLMIVLSNVALAGEQVDPANLPGVWSCSVDRNIEGVKVVALEKITVNKDQSFSAEGEQKIKVPAAQQSAGLPSEIYIKYQANGNFTLEGNTLTSNINETEITDTNHPSKEMLANSFTKPNRVETSTITVLSDKKLQHHYTNSEVVYDCEKQD